MKRLVLTFAILIGLAVCAPPGRSVDGLRANERRDAPTWLPDVHRLAEQGDATNQAFLGVVYEKGLGVPQDKTQAAKWYRKAAERRQRLEDIPRQPPGKLRGTRPRPL